jgi:hypothetical protein
VIGSVNVNKSRANVHDLDRDLCPHLLCLCPCYSNQQIQSRGASTSAKAQYTKRRNNSVSSFKNFDATPSTGREYQKRGDELFSIRDSQNHIDVQILRDNIQALKSREVGLKDKIARLYQLNMRAKIELLQLAKKLSKYEPTAIQENEYLANIYNNQVLFPSDLRDEPFS